MLNLTYMNHKNETYTFGRAGVYVNIEDLFDYEWDLVKSNDTIAGFKRGIATKKTKAFIITGTKTEGLRKKKALVDVTEADIMQNQRGKLIYGSQYLPCVITASKVNEYRDRLGLFCLTLEITTDDPFWVQETEKTLEASNAGQSGGKRYRYRYPYRYGARPEIPNLVINDEEMQEIQLVVFGPAASVNVTIGPAVYQVNHQIEAGEYVTIDGREKIPDEEMRIFLTKTDGERLSLFDYRDASHSVKQRIPPGIHEIQTSGAKVTIRKFAKRSEPVWI